MIQFNFDVKYFFPILMIFTIDTVCANQNDTTSYLPKFKLYDKYGASRELNDATFLTLGADDCTAGYFRIKFTDAINTGLMLLV